MLREKTLLWAHYAINTEKYRILRNVNTRMHVREKKKCIENPGRFTRPIPCECQVHMHKIDPYTPNSQPDNPDVRKVTKR